MVGRACLASSILVAVACLVHVPAAANAEVTTHVVESEHYRLHYEGSLREAREASKVLEAAWKGFEAWIGAAPTIPEGERLTIRFYATAGAWAAGIRADGTAVPHGAGGYYWPGTKTSYLYRQPTVYFTRVLLIHEAAHQFHFLTHTRNRNPHAAWYTEGLAEYLSWHRWDGTRLELGVIPGVTLKDYPAKALAEMEADGFDLGAVISGGVKASRAMSWALFCYLATGRDGKALPRFDEFRRRMDRGRRARPIFERYFGRIGRLEPKLRAWLEANQTPWAPVFNEWEQVGDGRFRGYAHVVTACRLKAPATRLAARLEASSARYWRAGLLLHWTSNQDYTVAMVTSWGGMRVDRRKDGRWITLDRRRLGRRLRGQAVRFEARREGGAVALSVDGTPLGRYELPGGILGLCLERGDLRFDEVRWN